MISSRYESIIGLLEIHRESISARIKDINDIIVVETDVETKLYNMGERRGLRMSRRELDLIMPEIRKILKDTIKSNGEEKDDRDKTD